MELENVPIGTTGAFLQQIDGLLNNLAPSNEALVEFTGGLNFTAGPKIPDKDLRELLGDVRLLDVRLQGTINEEQVQGQAEVSVIDPIIVKANGEVVLN